MCCLVFFRVAFSLPSNFCTPIGGIRVFSVLLGSFSFTFSFFQDALNDDVQHIDAFIKLKDL